MPSAVCTGPTAITSISIVPKTWSAVCEDGAVVFLSGEYRGHEGVRRLYGTGFRITLPRALMDLYGLLDHFRCRTLLPWRRTGKRRRVGFAAY
jgi:hypothetical protein